MKLEMVTIIACEVDTEVFTSDKMQVRKKKKKHAHVASKPGFAFVVVWLCSSFAQRTDWLACCPVQVHAWWRWMQPSLSLSLALGREFLSMGAAARPEPRARTVIDAGWIAEMRCRQGRNGTRATTTENSLNAPNWLCKFYRAGCWWWWCAGWIGGCDELNCPCKAHAGERSEAVF